MKKSILIITFCVFYNSNAQEYFAGYNTSNRIGVVQSSFFPSLLSFQTNAIDVHLGGLNINISNNKLSINDFLSDDFEAKLWNEDQNVSFRIDSEIIGLGTSFNYNNWGFGVLFQSNIKMNVTDINSKLGNAVINGSDNLTLANTLLNVKENQRINAAAWSEVGLSVSKVVFGKENHLLSFGATFKLLLPASYANFGLSNLNGELRQNLLNYELIKTSGDLNVAYSGNLAGNFNNSSNYTQSIIGKPNGLGIDVGTTYQWKKEADGERNLIISASIRNIGSMVFDDDNNKNTNYTLKGNINLNDFQNTNNIKDIENKLISNGNLIVENGNNAIKVNLPTTFNFMASAKIFSKLHGSIHLQQAILAKNDNNQITSNNFVTITPKLVFKKLELYTPLSNSDLGGFTSGFGIRVGGFYLGSGSVISAFFTDAKLLDAYFGFSFGIK